MGRRLDSETFAEGLHTARDRGAWPQGRALEAQRMLLELAPAAYLITDAVGGIQWANHRAAILLGVDRRFLAGRPLALYVAPDDRQRLWERLDVVDARDGETWPLRLRPRGRDHVSVVAATTVAHRQAGGIAEVHWQLLELPTAGEGAEAPSSPGSSGDFDDLAVALHGVIRAAAPLMRADDVGLLLIGQDGAVHAVTGADQPGQAVDRAERDLGEGPGVDALASGDAVWTADLWVDRRWPRLGAVARDSQVRGVLAAPVGDPAHPLGICKVSTRNPRTWSDGDIDAIRAFAAILARVISSVAHARHTGELAAQLQSALESRVLIEQAKGVLMERHGLGDQAAFERLRLDARSSSRKLTEVARDLIVNRAS